MVWRVYGYAPPDFPIGFGGEVAAIVWRGVVEIGFWQKGKGGEGEKTMMENWRKSVQQEEPIWSEAQQRRLDRQTRRLRERGLEW